MARLIAILLPENAGVHQPSVGDLAQIITHRLTVDLIHESFELDKNASGSGSVTALDRVLPVCWLTFGFKPVQESLERAVGAMYTAGVAMFGHSEKRAAQLDRSNCGCLVDFLAFEMVSLLARFGAIASDGTLVAPTSSPPNVVIC